MSISALFFNFSKRKNSLKVPVDSTGTTFNVNLKQPCSYQEPVLTLSNSGFSYNYAKFEGNYYFVSDIVSLRADLWEVHLKKDVLASYRSAILSQTAYVMYDNVGNSEIVDTRIPVNTTSTISKNVSTFPSIDASGMYVLGITGKQSTALWAASPSAIQFSTLMSEALANSKLDPNDPDESFDLSTFNGAMEFVGKQIWKTGSSMLSSGNALAAIRSCIWIPFPQSVVFGQSNQPIFLGNFDTGTTGKRFGSFPLTHLTTISISIPWQFSDWRKNSPYTQLYCHIPFIGTVNIPTAQVTGASSLLFDFGLNIANGDIACDIMTDTQEFVGSYGGNCGVEILIGNSNTIQKGLTNTIIGAAAAGVGAALGLGVGAAALSGVAVNAANQLAGNPTTVGGISGGAGAMLTTNISVFTVCHNTAVAPSSVAGVIGLPSFQSKALSGLTGYCQTAEFSLDAAAHDADRIEVNNFMNSGVFIE